MATATVVFTNADMVYTASGFGDPGSPFTAIVWTPDGMEGDTGSQPNGGGFIGQAWAVVGHAFDDGSVPADAVLTDATIAFDWTMTTPGQLGLDPNFVTAASGNFSGNYSNVTDLFGGTTRADLFNDIGWFYTITNASNNPSQVAVSNYVLSVTYTYTPTAAVTKVTPNGGTTLGGTSVIITGLGFNTPATGVSFGGVAATSWSILSDTQIQAVTPAHFSGTVDVVVDGVGTGTDLYTYVIDVAFKLPPVPVRSTIGQIGTGRGSGSGGGTDMMQLDYQRWLMEVKKVLEQPFQISAEQITGTAMTGVSDTNVTVTLSGEPTEALLRPVTVTMGWQGALTAARGGTGQTGYAVGDLLYASSPVILSRLADVSAGSYLRSGGVATAPLWSTLKLPNAGAVGDLPFVSSTDTVTMLADVSAGSYLRSGGVLTAPLWSTLKIPNAAATGDILYASSANTVVVRTIGSANDVLTVTGGVPVWAAPAAAGTVTITNDTTTNATMFPTWVTANTGALPLFVTSTKLSFNPSTGLLNTTALTASGAIIADTPSLVVDATNHRLGVGIASPLSRLHVSNAGESLVNISNSSAASNNDWGVTVGSGTQHASGIFVIGPGTGTPLASAKALTLQVGGVVTIGNSTDSVLATQFRTLSMVANSAGVAGSNISLWAFTGNNAGSLTHVSGQVNVVGISQTFAPTSGTGTFRGLAIESAINQTGGASGITRGLYVNATVTAAADFRSIETSVGNVVFGATSGNVGIGTSNFPATGSASVIFADGTIPATMASNTAGLYANDVSGTVNMFGINEAGTVTQLTGLTSAYTITNVTTDRSYDANATTLDEIADTLGTLIADLQARGICG